MSPVSLCVCGGGRGYSRQPGHTFAVIAVIIQEKGASTVSPPPAVRHRQDYRRCQQEPGGHQAAIVEVIRRDYPGKDLV